MAYSKTTWKDKVIQKPRTYNLQNNPDSTITLIPDEGVVQEAGTPVNAANMNRIETGISEAHSEIDNINFELRIVDDKFWVVDTQMDEQLSNIRRKARMGAM